MGLFRSRTATEETANEQSQPELDSVTSIASVELRTPTSLCGTVMQISTMPTAGLPSLAVTVKDATGTIVAVWAGRRAIGGISLGRRLVLTGVATQGRHQIEMHNPEYALLP